MTDLLPCPFCGESWVHINKTRYLDTEAFAGTCRTKGCHGVIFSLGYGLFETEAEAIAAWNHRAADALSLKGEDVERVKLALSPLVNEEMDEEMRDAWLTDLARAAIAAMPSDTMRSALEDAREFLEGIRIDYPLSVSDCEFIRALLAKIDKALSSPIVEGL